MPRRHQAKAFLIATMLGIAMLGCGSGEAIDTEFPPGDPTIGDAGTSAEPVEALTSTDSTNYGLLILIAACLIAAGVLLVRIERWERRRTGDID